MRILLLADEPDKRLWDHLDKRRLEGVDLIVSCGDLPAAYLSFLTCFTPAPIVYIHGNHDASYETRPPEGCICIEDRVVNFHGLRIAGLGGSMRYKPGPYQYTDQQMARRALRLSFAIAMAHGVDMIVTHAPMRGVGDAEDLCHRGFTALRDIVDRWHPMYFCHGHVHKDYDFRFQRQRAYGETTVVNAWVSHVIELEPPRPEGRRRGQRTSKEFL